MHFAAKTASISKPWHSVQKLILSWASKNFLIKPRGYCQICEFVGPCNSKVNMSTWLVIGPELDVMIINILTKFGNDWLMSV